MRWLLKRWWFWAGVLLMSVAICSATYLFIPSVNSRITQENCDKIQYGWTTEEVDMLLGKHKYGSLASLDPVLKGDRDPNTFYFSHLYEDEDGNRLVVNYDKGERVYEKHFTPTRFLRRMQYRIGRCIQALWP
jgi:hypothetical protein